LGATRQGHPPRHPISRRKVPKYSPDLNPIEQVFAKLKHLFRNATSRTLESLVAARSANSSEPSQPKNAPTTSPTQFKPTVRDLML
jgi:transposase